MEAVPNALAQPDAHVKAQASVAGRLWDAPGSVRLWHLASFDAPTVAVAWALAFAWAVRARLPLWLLAVLALTTWAIYIADRLLDARKALRCDRLDSLRDRHFFHWRHRRWFAPLSILALLAAASLVASRMAHSSLPSGTVLAVAAFGYFANVHSDFGSLPRTPRRRSLTVLPILSSIPSPVPSKELLVGVLFTAGCLVPAWIRSAARPGWLAIAAVFFAALAWLNCRAIELWESDKRTGVARQALLTALAGLLLALPFFASHPRIASLLICGVASCLLLAMLDRVRNRMTPLALRAAADLVLLTPLVLLLR